MTKKYAIINFKGGVGKTTITWLIGKYLSQYKNQNILMVDLDPQMSLTLGLSLKDDGFLKNNYNEWFKERLQKKETIYYLMESYYKNSLKDYDLSSFVFNNEKNLFILPSYEKLYLIELMNYERKKFKNFIKDIIYKLNEKYLFDIVLFDCPPNFTNLTYSVFEYVNQIIVPCNPDIYAKKGLELLIQTLQILITKYGLTQKEYDFYSFINKARLHSGHFTNETQNFYDELKKLQKHYYTNFKIHVLNTYLPERVDIKRAMQNQKFPEDYDYYLDSLCNEIGVLD
ncbi:MAG: hypothetical protein KatS3mg129_0131 [Leptospiraceae bacterium]|nr:MAG: hypothetical protein KatS3mg129_0131 [Leptospiraceae bacterium]